MRPRLRVGDGTLAARSDGPSVEERLHQSLRRLTLIRVASSWVTESEGEAEDLLEAISVAADEIAELLEPPKVAPAAVLNHRLVTGGER